MSGIIFLFFLLVLLVLLVLKTLKTTNSQLPTLFPFLFLPNIFRIATQILKFKNFFLILWN